MNTNDFLDILDHRDLIPKDIVAQLRKKASQQDTRITPQAVLKYLVKKEYVTRTQAKQLLETTLTVTPLAASSIFGMVPLPEIPAERKPSKQPPEVIPTLTPMDPEPRRNAPMETVSSAPLDGVGSGMLADSLSTTEADDAFAEAPEPTPGKKSKRRKGKRGKNKNEWDSPLLLIGGAGLAILLFIAAVTYVLIGQEDAEVVLAEASGFYEGESYLQAIKQYAHFVEVFDGHPQFSTAKVKLGMAKLWHATKTAANPILALDTAKQVLDEIEDEAEFKSAERELASLLPEIAQGLAGKAEKATEPAKIDDLIEKTNISLSLCNNTKYITKKFRDEVLLDEVRETLERVKRTRLQGENLAAALAAMQTAIDAEDTAKAYAIHKQLIAENAGLLNNEVLAAKVLEISTAEATVVKYVAESLAAATDERPSPIIAALTLAKRDGSPADGTEGTVAVRIDGAVFGLDAKDGSVDWRRFLGIAPKLTPKRLSSGELLVIDDQHYELLKLAGDSGKLIWRLKFDSPISQPVEFEERLLIAERSGKLHVVDIASGERSGYVLFAQKLPVPPAVDAKMKRIYVVGEHSSLYSISAEDFSCLGVYYLGHSPGNVSTPPVSVLGKVLVAENKGAATSHLKVLATNNEGVVNAEATSERLAGLVDTPLLVEGRRLVVVTSRGQVTVYEIGPDDGDSALTQIATREAEKASPVARFGLFERGHVWVGGKQLTKLAVLPTGNRLLVRDIESDYLGDIFDHPLQKIGDSLIHVRRPRNKAGAIVAAMQMESGQTTWETSLAVPLAGPPAVDAAGARITALSASGAAYVLDRQAMSRGVQDKSIRLRPSERRQLPALTECVDLGQGRLAACKVATDILLHFRPNDPRRPLTLTKLASQATCRPVVWGDAVVVPTRVGQVFLFDRETGDQLGSPFQPPLSPNTSIHWLAPAVYRPGENSQLILSDGRNKIYRLALLTDPQLHLQAEAEGDVGPAPLASRLSVIGDLACAGTDDGRLALYQLPSLEAEPYVDLGAQIVWGPFAVGETWILATDTEELVALAAQGQITWRQPLAHGPTTGLPLVDGNDLFILWQQGGLSRIAIESGSEAGHVDLRQPTIAGPVAFGKRLAVSTSDGTLLILERP